MVGRLDGREDEAVLEREVRVIGTGEVRSYRLSEVIRYLIVLVGPYVGNATQRSRAFTVAQCVCVSSSMVAPHVQRTLTYSQVPCCPLSLI